MPLHNELYCYGKENNVQPIALSYLKDHSFQDLEDNFGICSRVNAVGDKVSLNYDQILSKPGDPVVAQCRGLVIRPRNFSFLKTPDWKTEIVGEADVLARPMDRFYNRGDFNAADVNWSDPELRVYEKLDGTMILLYWDPLHQRWHAGTRSVSEADLPIQKDHLSIGDMTFSELFWYSLWQTLHQLGYGNTPAAAPTPYDAVWPFLDELDKSYTYVFELTGPHNRVVVKYAEKRVYLLAVRNTLTGVELPIENFSSRSFLHAQKWSLHEPLALVAFIETCDPAKFEGAVVVDSNFNRQKVKSAAWAFSSRAKDMVTSSPRAALECIIMNKLDDVIPLVEEEIGRSLLDIQEKFVRYCRGVDERYVAFKYEADGSRKRFAELVMLSGDWSAPYFNLWENRAPSMLEWSRSMLEKGKLSHSNLDMIIDKMNR